MIMMMIMIYDVCADRLLFILSIYKRIYIFFMYSSYSQILFVYVIGVIIAVGWLYLSGMPLEK